MRGFAFILLCVGLGSAALAHSGVKNPVVQARMDNMGAMTDQIKVIGQMAAGKTAFDAAKARAAAQALADLAAATPDLFALPEMDPKTEARPRIWANYDDFTAKSQSLERLALNLTGQLKARDALPDALVALGASCKACHSQYRQ